MHAFDVQTVIRSLQSVLPMEDGGVALHEPEFKGREWAYVKECLDTGWVSSVGKFVDRFETDLAAYTGVRRAVVVTNGTVALHVCLKLAGVEAGDEVLMPALTFVATANAVSYCGATPHFVDSETCTLGVDPRKLSEYLAATTELRGGACVNKKTGCRIRAIIPMHTYGHPVDLDALAEVCRDFRLEMIEDAAESLGSFYKGRHTGNWGRVSALSFNGNKIITTGGGGAILTNDEELGVRAKHLTTTAKTPHKWAYEHDQVGFNYRMPNLNAALGCAQLERIASFVEQKRSLAVSYAEAFAKVDGVEFFKEPEFAKSNYWLNTLLLDEKSAARRDELLEKTNSAGIMTRPAWTLMHKLPMFKDHPHMDLSVAEDLSERLINIPSSAKLGRRHGQA